jgi:ligand-binding sensor domain-containing protein/signal transduction histidine kinase
MHRLPQHKRNGKPGNCPGLNRRFVSFCLSLLLAVICFGSDSPAQQNARFGAVTNVKRDVEEGADLRFRHLSAESGISHTRVSDLLQDDRGFLWMGTQYGLNRYDGARVRTINHEIDRPYGPGGTYVRGMLIDRDGKMWISFGSTFDRYDPTIDLFTHFDLATLSGMPNDTMIRQIEQDKSGTLWLSTTNGLVSFEIKTQRTRVYSAGPTVHDLRSSTIMSSGEDRLGNFWVASDMGLDRLDRNSGQVIEHTQVQGSQSDMNFHEDREGTFWVSTGKARSLAILNRETHRMTTFSFSDGGVGDSADAITAMLEDRDGDMWFGTAGKGLLRYSRKDGRFTRYRNDAGNSESLTSNRITALLQDQRGDIWVALNDSGPDAFTPHAPTFRAFVHSAGNSNSLHTSLVSSIFEQRPGVLWIGSTSAYQRLDRSRGIYTYAPEIAHHTEVLDVIRDQQGAILAGTSSQGIARLDSSMRVVGHFVQNDQKPSSLSSQHVQRLLVDSSGRLWVATWGGLDLYRPETNDFEVFDFHPRGKENFYSIAEAPNGTIWLGGNLGIERFDPRTLHVTNYLTGPDRLHSISDNRVNSIAFDSGGAAWIGTQSGLDKFNIQSGIFTHYNARSGLNGNVVSCILPDHKGQLWMSTNRGMSRLNLTSMQFTNYGPLDGLPGGDMSGWNVCSQSVSGEMFFGGFSGATAFFPDQVLESKYIPPIVLTDLKIHGVQVDADPSSPLSQSLFYSKHVQLSHEQNALSFGFTAIEFLDPRGSRYRFKLEGLDSVWTETDSEQRVASYVGLHPGNYMFRVQVATRRGPWSDPGIQLSINISQPWWNTRPVRFLYVLSAACLCWLVYKVRTIQIESWLKMRIEIKVNERTRIAREIHDTLLQSMQGIILRFQSIVYRLPPGDSTRDSIEQTLDRAESALGEGRDAIRDLRSVPILPSELLKALHGAALEFSLSHPGVLSFRQQGFVRPLAAEDATEILHIGTEALRNAFRHSAAANVDVNINFSRRKTVFSFRDNGHGIPQTVLKAGGVPGHWGLLGMKERASKIGASLTINSSAREGTEIILVVPCKWPLWFLRPKGI